jgi:hypothetical protein
MNEQELKSLWQSTHQQLDASIAVNKRLIVDINRLGVKSSLADMKPIKWFTLIVGSLWVSIGGYVMYHLIRYARDEISIAFMASASFQIAITTVALIIYIYQLVTIYDVDVSDTVLSTQKRLQGLRSSTMTSVRISFLQLPVWTTFYLHEGLFTEWNVFQWMIQIIATLAFAILAGWLFVNIRYENRDKRWFKLIFRGSEWDPIIRAEGLLREIEEFKEDSGRGLQT